MGNAESCRTVTILEEQLMQNDPLFTLAMLSTDTTLYVKNKSLWRFIRLLVQVPLPDDAVQVE